jgi:hypothetical protein
MTDVLCSGHVCLGLLPAGCVAHGSLEYLPCQPAAIIATIAKQVHSETDMTDHHEALAKETVQRFRDSLSHEAREYITAAQLEDLEQAIRELLSRERGHIADLMEALARTLRSGVDKPELEL